VAFSPVVTGTGLAEDKVVGVEDLAVWAGSDGFHGVGFKIHEDGAWNVPSIACFIIVDVDAFELELRVVAVLSGSGNHIQSLAGNVAETVNIVRVSASRGEINKT